MFKFKRLLEGGLAGESNNKQYAKGGGIRISHYKVGNEIFIDYMDAMAYCDENNISYDEIIKTKEYAKGGGVKEIKEVFEVFIDMGDEGTRTIADFDTKKQAQKFIYEYNLKHPKAKLHIDTLTSDYMKELPQGKYANGGGVDFNQYGEPYGFSQDDWDAREYYIREFLRGIKYPSNTDVYKKISNETGYSIGDIMYVHQKMNNDLDYNVQYSNGGGVGFRNIDKIKNNIGKQIFDHITSLTKPQLEKQLSELKSELKIADKESNRYTKLKNEEWYILYRLERVNEFQYAEGGGVGFNQYGEPYGFEDEYGSKKYKIFEGYDHYKGIYLYKVVGIDNDFEGEWYTNKSDAENELSMLENESYAKGGGVKNLTYEIREKVNEFLFPLGYSAKVDDEFSNGEIHIEPDTRKVGNNRSDFFYGMQIIRFPDGTYEVSEYQAGEKNNELFIYKETKSLALALKELIKGNNRKPIKKYAKGGFFDDSYNRGRSWHLDRARHNKSEKYEVPVNKRRKN